MRIKIITRMIFYFVSSIIFLFDLAQIFLYLLDLSTASSYHEILSSTSESSRGQDTHSGFLIMLTTQLLTYLFCRGCDVLDYSRYR